MEEQTNAGSAGQARAAGAHVSQVTVAANGFRAARLDGQSLVAHTVAANGFRAARLHGQSLVAQTVRRFLRNYDNDRTRHHLIMREARGLLFFGKLLEADVLGSEGMHSSFSLGPIFYLVKGCAAVS